MTDEELDEARIAEARRLTDGWATPDMFRHIARLAREGWTPVDPMLIEAREIVANDYAERGYQGLGKAARDGAGDKSLEMRFTLAGIKRGIEIGKAQP